MNLARDEQPDREGGIPCSLVIPSYDLLTCSHLRTEGTEEHFLDRRDLNSVPSLAVDVKQVKFSLTTWAQEKLLASKRHDAKS